MEDVLNDYTLAPDVHVPRRHLTVVARLAMRMARLQGASLAVVGALAGVSARTAISVTSRVPKGPVADRATAELGLRGTTLAEVGADPDNESLWLELRAAAGRLGVRWLERLAPAAARKPARQGGAA